MKKIALFTWHNGDCNCGQTLQAFALQKKIEQLGAECVIIDYLYFGKKIYHNFFIWPIYRLYDDLRNHRLKKRTKFDRFVKKDMCVSPRFFCFKAVEKYITKNKIGNYLLGSDQVWNPQSGIIPDVMLLGFEKGHKFAYSPSMCNEVDYTKYETEIKRISKAANEFNIVGVRESNARRMLQKAGCTRDISVVLDPVFLFDADEWKDLLDLKAQTSGYILVYCLGELTDSIIDCVNTVKDSKPVCYIETSDSVNYPKDWKCIKNVGPQEYVGLIKGADFVIGDSFHMVAFSIIFRKQFFVFSSVRKAFEPNMDRVTDLLLRMGLMDRYNDTEAFKNPIDYPSCENKIMDCIDESKQHLTSILDQCCNYD